MMNSNLPASQAEPHCYTAEVDLYTVGHAGRNGVDPDESPPDHLHPAT
jgi:hypothetical protein